MSREQITVFNDAACDWDYAIPSQPDSTFAVADNSDSNLDNFFERPIKIAEFSWNIATNLFQEFDPWDLYFNNKRVVNRIANYNLLRANLHVKFMVNGNSFYYGRLIASYTPLNTVDNLTLNRSFFLADIVEASQRPHIYIDPTASQGGTLNLPFVYPFHALSIPLSQWTEMGSINLRSINLLRHANGGTDPITVSVFAWASDVHFSIPTSVNPTTMVPQGDEYGVISTPAAVVARAAASLSMVPVLKPYALASQMAAETVGAIAKMFGFSRPVIVEDIIPFRPTFGNYANSNAGDCATKLTFDRKQEVTVDSRVCGLAGSDEMSIRSIATHEAYVTTFDWPVAAANESILWNCRVTPSIWNVVTGPPDEYHLTPPAFAVIPFKWWRGSMRYRFQVVASGFHKGRLKFVYEPFVVASNEYNTNYTRIIDISTEKDLTVTVGWGNTQPFLTHNNPGDVYTPYSSAALTGGDQNNTNGILSVYVVNSLTEPNSTAGSNVQINVFVSAGDDFEVVEPIQCKLNGYTWARPPSAGFAAVEMEPQGAEEMVTEPEDSRPMMEGDGHMMASKVHGTADIYKIMFADPVASFRQCVKRYCLHTLDVLGPQTSTNLALTTVTKPDFPYLRGNYSAGAVNSSGAANFAKFTILNYVTPAFVCRRGGMRWKYMSGTGVGGSNGNYMSAKREPCTNTYGVTISNLTITTVDALQANISFVPGSWDGSQVQPRANNSTLEIDLPFYTNRRFWYGKRNDPSSTLNSTFHSTSSGTAAVTNTATYAYVAGSDDFDLSFFTGAPILYIV